MNASKSLLPPDFKPSHQAAVAVSCGPAWRNALGFGRSLTAADVAFCSLPVVAFLAIVSLV